ncbi:unnamed protein product, partial [Sphacelaria rigidula]
ASGVCHSDTFTVVGGTGVNYPGIPGHEVVGKVVKTGPGAIAQTFAEGTIVGVGWHGSHCFTCESCTDGDFVNCEKATITGVSRPGGYQEYAVVEASALARVPDGMDPTDAAPLMCAGVTVFNGLRANISKAQPPALVAVVGIGGLGHVAIQYAAKFGYTVVAISRGTKKKAHAMELGATHYIDSTAENVAQALMALGGAKVVLCTATNAKSMGDCIDGLSRHGRLVVLGASTDDIPVSPLQLIVKSRAIVGHLTGSARDSQDAMEFAHKHGIKPSKVMFDGIEKAPDAYAAMRRGEYRVVIKL